MTRSNLILSVLALVGSAMLGACAGAASRQPASWPGLASDGTTAYLAINQSVYAVDVASGSARWQYPAEPQRSRSFYAAPAITPDGNLLVGDFMNQLTQIRAVDGLEVWGPVPLSDDQNERIIGAPTIAGELVLVSSTDGRLYARSLADGSAVWTFPAESDPPLEEAIWAAPLVVGDRVYLAAMDHHVYAIDLSTGQGLWSSPPDLDGAVADTPILAGDRLLVGSFASRIVALDPDSGRELWRYDTADWVWSSPAISSEVAYFGDLSGVLHSIGVARGTQDWNIDLGSRIIASPLVDGDQLYVVTEGGLLLARQSDSGNPAWQVVIQGQLLTNPLLIDGTLLVASNGGDPLLSAYEAQSGAQRWSFTP